MGWLYPTQDLQTAVPFISLEGSEIHRQESLNEEYDILPNGSLVISNVTYSHEKNYSARLVKNGAVSHLGVQVKVYGKLCCKLCQVMRKLKNLLETGVVPNSLINTN